LGPSRRLPKGERYAPVRGGDSSESWSIEAGAYHGEWYATDQIASRAVAAGLISRFGELDPTDGGLSDRYAVSAQWNQSGETGRFNLLLYGFYYDLALFSNFTYFLRDPIHGDQFEQRDERFCTGLAATETFFQHGLGLSSSLSLGIQSRLDRIHSGLFDTEDRKELSSVRRDFVWEASVGPYLIEDVRWTEAFRTVVGLRSDFYDMSVRSALPINTGERTAVVTSPKVSLILGPWWNSELYFNGGLAFHSNDARGTTTHIDPVTGELVSPATPLVRTYGAEIGLRSRPLARGSTTLAFWWLDLDSELVFLGDAGTTEPSRPSRRYGVEWTGTYSPWDWLAFDGVVALSNARFRKPDPVGDHVPESIESAATAGVTFRHPAGYFASLRLRYFGPRSLIEDNSVRSHETYYVSSLLGYHSPSGWELRVELFNLLNRAGNEIEYFYISRLRGEPAQGVADTHFHPFPPVSVRAGLRIPF
jgi:hypothetical protein